MENTQHQMQVPKELENPKQRSRLNLDKRLVDLINQGYTHRLIAEHLGVCESAIERRCRRLGLKSGRTGPRSGLGHPKWKTGRVLDKHGYIKIWAPLHPNASRAGYALEHALVMELTLGRYLTQSEVIHHIDVWPYHNWPKNLKLFASNADHLRHELAGRPRPNNCETSLKRHVPGAYKSNQRILHCPSKSETLAQCSSEIIQRLDYYIESHRPTTEHRMMAKKAILRTGAWRMPFLEESKE